MSDNGHVTKSTYEHYQTPYLYYYWTNLFPEYYEGGEWPFGDPAQVTVCGYTGSTAQELAAEYGYSFEALAE